MSASREMTPDELLDAFEAEFPHDRFGDIWSYPRLALDRERAAHTRRTYAPGYASLIPGDDLELLLTPDEDGVARIYNGKGEVWIELLGDTPWTLYTAPPAAHECPDPSLHYGGWRHFRASFWDWLHDKMFGKHGEW